MNEGLIGRMDALHQRISSSQRELFSLILEVERQEAWRDAGAWSLAHFLQIRYGISNWKAHRFIGAAHALEVLPRLSEAFSRGELGVDKVVELARFATPGTEADLVRWAQGVSPARVRAKADLAVRPSIEDARQAHRDRFLEWWHLDDGRRIGLAAELPAADGAIVVTAIERLTSSVPEMPGEEGGAHVWARRADALVAICSAAAAADADPDRATVVVHAGLDALVSDRSSGEIEGGGVIHPEIARRLACTARVQTVVEDGRGNPVWVGRITREPPPWMIRQLRHRDVECRFPGCGARRFTQAHHIVWWRHGGRTELDNLALVCTFHHKLVHELGWRICRAEDGEVSWYQPDGTRYRAGPSPPERDGDGTIGIDAIEARGSPQLARVG
jgi:hypothetical protein